MTLDEKTLRVWIDEGCISCGMCASLVPTVFRVDAGSTSRVLPGWATWAASSEDSEEHLRGARDSCPVDVIRLGA